MQEKEIIKAINSGKIFIYPTDTIYGLGCDATNKKAVNKIREMKKSDGDKPLSVIAPSMKWIKDNFVIDVDIKKYLPGPYTLLLKKKKKKFLKNISSNEMIGVRIPDNDFTGVIQKSEKPFVTTSVNISGEAHATSVKDLKKEMKSKIDVIIDVGPLSGRPSILIINGKEVKR